MEFDLNKIVPGEPPFDTRQDDDLVEWVEVGGIEYATQQEVAQRIRELEAKYEEAEACARCEHEKRLGIEQQRDELAAKLRYYESALCVPDAQHIAVQCADGHVTCNEIAPVRVASLLQQCDELLAALKEVVALSDRKHEAWDVARAVITKVEGRE